MRRHRQRRWASRLSLVLLLAGVLGFVEIGLTMFWQEPFSSWAARGRQAEVHREVGRLLNVSPTIQARGMSAAQLRARARRADRAARTGHGIGRLSIPAIGLTKDVVQGTNHDSLGRGLGHYPGTDFPGERGTVGIAGHRTTYGAPFRHLDALARGDRIVMTMPYGRFTYRVDRTQVVTPDRTDVVRDVGNPQLVLSACTPLFSSARRIIVFAHQVSAAPA